MRQQDLVSSAKRAQQSGANQQSYSKSVRLPDHRPAPNIPLTIIGSHPEGEEGLPPYYESETPVLLDAMRRGLPHATLTRSGGCVTVDLGQYEEDPTAPFLVRVKGEESDKSRIVIHVIPIGPWSNQYLWEIVYLLLRDHPDWTVPQIVAVFTRQYVGPDLVTRVKNLIRFSGMR